MTKPAYQPNPFRSDVVQAVLAPVWHQYDPTSIEFAALQESAHAMLFPFVPPDSIYDDQGRIIAGADELIVDMERGHAFVAHLQTWAQAVLSRGIAVQIEFLSRAGLAGEPAESMVEAPMESFHEDDEENDEDVPESEETRIPTTFPEPLQAISVLNSLADRYDLASVERTAIELAEQTLRYIVDMGQAEAFVAFLEEAMKPCPPEKLERFGVLNDSS